MCISHFPEVDGFMNVCIHGVGLMRVTALLNFQTKQDQYPEDRFVFFMGWLINRPREFKLLFWVKCQDSIEDV